MSGYSIYNVKRIEELPLGKKVMVLSLDNEPIYGFVVFNDNFSVEILYSNADTIRYYKDDLDDNEIFPMIESEDDFISLEIPNASYSC